MAWTVVTEELPVWFTQNVTTLVARFCPSTGVGAVGSNTTHGAPLSLNCVDSEGWQVTPSAVRSEAEG